MRDVVLEVRDLGADRVGQQQRRCRRAPRPQPGTRSRIASPRGTWARSSIRTSGLRISAATDATIRISSTEPAARASAHRPSSASGSTTSWTQRGTTTGGPAWLSAPVAVLAGRHLGASYRGARAYGELARLGLGRPVVGSPPSSLRALLGWRDRLATRSAWEALDAFTWKYAPAEDVQTRHQHPVRRRHRRRDRAAHAADAATRPAGAARPRLRRGQRRERRRGASGSPRRSRDDLFANGVDVITLGNHTYRHREVYPYLDEEDADPPPRQLPAQPARARLVRGRPRRRAARGGVAVGQPVHERRPAGVQRGRRGAARAQRQGRPRARRHARRGHQREGRDGMAPRREGDRGRRDPHPHSRPPTPGSCRAEPPTSPTSA